MSAIVASRGAGGAPSSEALARAAAHLRAGRPVALPTDTVYGLAALPTVAGATGALFALKGRSEDVPVAVLCASAAQALDLAASDALGAEVHRIAARLWPGPLTLVLPRRPGVDYDLGSSPGTIGLRCPDHALVQALAAEVGPLATTSANPHGEPTPPTAAGVAGLFGDRLALVIDGGPCRQPPSTVVDATGPRWRILRAGVLSAADLEAAACA